MGGLCLGKWTMSEKLFSEVAILLHPADNVAVLKHPLKRGDELRRDSNFTISQNVPAGHKIAISNIGSGEAIRKYGQIIGFASCDIAPGEHVHTHNVVLKEFGRDYQFCVDARPVDL